MGAKRILIVEDMPDWRDQLQATLRRDGYDITTVPSDGEALAELRRNPYELVLVDLRLSPADESNRDGMELLRDLARANIPAVVVTGYGGVELARKAIDQYHAFDFMEKQTLDLNRLREVIKAAFKKVKGYLPPVVVIHISSIFEAQIKREVAQLAESLGTKITIGHEGMKLKL
jgi:DNA-binding NtrC family response regulator